MQVALTPLEFIRRARKLYSGLEAVVDGDSSCTYTQFFERCDRWSAALQYLGARPGDRVAYIAPNTRAQLESFNAVPQIGAVLVPINYRLNGDDFAYLINHSGAGVVCVDCDYMDAVDHIRPQLKNVEQFVALNAERHGWLNYEKLLREFRPSFTSPDVSYSPAPPSSAMLALISGGSGMKRESPAIRAGSIASGGPSPQAQALAIVEFCIREVQFGRRASV